MTATTLTPLPKAFDLQIPGGTYTAAPTYVEVDRRGAWFATSMSGYGVPAGQFGIHVWYRPTFTAPWQLIRFRDKCHGSLHVLMGKLYFIINQDNKQVGAELIERWGGVWV